MQGKYKQAKIIYEKINPSHLTEVDEACSETSSCAPGLICNKKNVCELNTASGKKKPN